MICRKLKSYFPAKMREYGKVATKLFMPETIRQRANPIDFETRSTYLLSSAFRPSRRRPRARGRGTRSTTVSQGVNVSTSRGPAAQQIRVTPCQEKIEYPSVCACAAVLSGLCIYRNWSCCLQDLLAVESSGLQQLATAQEEVRQPMKH